VPALKFAEEERQDGLAGARGGAELEPPAERSARLSRHLLEHLLLEREQLLGTAVEREARLRRLDAAARAVEQLPPEPLLERADLEADGRLRDPEPLGGLRKTA
jgi:hypothetical protein